MKKFIYFISVLVAVAGLIGIYLFNKKPADTRSMKADFEITSVDLVSQFSANEELASKRFVDKVLLVSGKVNEVDTASSTVFLVSSDPLSFVTCNFYTAEAKTIVSLKQGDQVRIKGKCTGKLMDVVLNSCSMVNQ